MKVHWTGDDRLDWAAGLEGEVIDERKITVPSGEMEYVIFDEPTIWRLIAFMEMSYERLSGMGER